MSNAILVYVNACAAGEVKDRGPSIKMSELEEPPFVERLKEAWHEQKETVRLVDHEGPHQITTTHSGKGRVRALFVAAEYGGGTSVMRHITKLHEMNDESALCFLFGIMRTRTPKELLDGKCPANVKDACYPGKVVKVRGNLRSRQRTDDFDMVQEDGGNQSIVVTGFSEDSAEHFGDLLSLRKSVVIGIVGRYASDGVPVLRCAGLFLESD